MNTIKQIAVVGVISIFSVLMLSFILKQYNQPQQHIQQSLPQPQIIKVESPSNSNEEIMKILIQLLTNKTHEIVKDSNPVIKTTLIPEPVLTPTSELYETQWLSSPITQVWEWDDRKQLWVMPMKYPDCLRSPPSIIIGLRSDGTVIWKKVK